MVLGTQEKDQPARPMLSRMSVKEEGDRRCTTDVLMEQEQGFQTGAAQ